MKNRLVNQKNGQFIIIAVLFIATMIISIGAILYSTVTYYKYEPWEEYNTIIDGIQLNTFHVVELSLSNYSNGDFNSSILKANLDGWKKDLTKIYPSYGVSLDYQFSEDDGMQHQEIENSSSLAANVTFNINIASLGLHGYEFVTSPSLNLSIIDGALLVDEATNTTALNVTVTSSEGIPVFGLTEKDFHITGNPFYVIACTDYYTNSTDYPIVYTLIFDNVPTDPFGVELIDQRGMRLVVLVYPPADP